MMSGKSAVVKLTGVAAVVVLLFSSLETNANLVTSHAGEVQARESLEVMKGRYRAMKMIAPSEIELACMGEVFAYWFREYEPIVKTSVGDSMSKMTSYQEAVALVKNHESDMKSVYPMMRSKVAIATRQVLAQLRVEDPSVAVPGDMSLTEIYKSNFEHALNRCSAADYVAEIETLAPIVGDLDVERVVTAVHHSLMPIYGGGGGGIAGAVGAFPGNEVVGVLVMDSEQSLPLIDWIDRIRSR